jgi:hypothetical protein
MRVDWPLPDLYPQRSRHGDHKIIHAACHSGMIVIISDISGVSSYISLACYTVDVQIAQPLNRITPSSLPDKICPSRITAIAINQNYIFIAIENKILVWNRVTHHHIITLVSPDKRELPTDRVGSDCFVNIIVRDGCVRLLLLFATWPLGHLPPLLTYTAYDYCMSHSLLLTNTIWVTHLPLTDYQSVLPSGRTKVYIKTSFLICI